VLLLGSTILLLVAATFGARTVGLTCCCVDAI